MPRPQPSPGNGPHAKQSSTTGSVRNYSDPKEHGSEGLQVMSRTPPVTDHRPLRLRTFALLRALRTHRQAGSQISKVCVPGGQVPLRTLVRVSDLQIFTIIDDFARLEPHTVVLHPS